MGKEGKEGPNDRLETVSREPIWAKKVPRIGWRWFQEDPTWAKKVPRID